MLSIADKLDTLGSFFSVGIVPTGSKDPFALRRAALGIIRILTEGKVRLTIGNLCLYADAGAGRDALEEFLIERLRYSSRDVHGFSYDEVNAVLAVAANDRDPFDVLNRVQALATIRPTPNFEPLAVSFKRRLLFASTLAHSRPRR